METKVYSSMYSFNECGVSKCKFSTEFKSFPAKRSAYYVAIKKQCFEDAILILKSRGSRLERHSAQIQGLQTLSGQSNLLIWPT